VGHGVRATIEETTFIIELLEIFQKLNPLQHSLSIIYSTQMSNAINFFPVVAKFIVKAYFIVNNSSIAIFGRGEEILK
jgi:hypothetical protein